MNSQANITPLQPQNKLDHLAQQLTAAKFAENDARQQRFKIEKEILEVVGCKTEGTTSITTDRFKITTTGRLTRSLDQRAVDLLIQDQVLPVPLLNRLFKPASKLDLREFKYVEANEPEYFAKVAIAVTTKPGKAAVAVTPLSE